MDIKTCRFLAQYNEKTNQKMNSLIRNLSNSQWNLEFAGYFRNIKQLCSHIYIADYNWLKRFGQLRDFRFIQESLFNEVLNYSSNPFSDPDDYISKREKLDKKLIQFVEEVTERDLGAMLSYKNAKGEMQNKNFGGLILSVFNHQTHHRGMIAVYLDSMKIENDFSSMFQLV